MVKMRWNSMVRKHKMSLQAQTFISAKIEQLVHEGYPIKQAKAIAYSEARAKHFKIKKRREPTESEKKYYPSFADNYGY